MKFDRHFHLKIGAVVPDKLSGFLQSIPQHAEVPPYIKASESFPASLPFSSSRLTLCYERINNNYDFSPSIGRAFAITIL
jgi:hypothetical protein